MRENVAGGRAAGVLQAAGQIHRGMDFPFICPEIELHGQGGNQKS